MKCDDCKHRHHIHDTPYEELWCKKLIQDLWDARPQDVADCEHYERPKAYEKIVDPLA